MNAQSETAPRRRASPGLRVAVVSAAAVILVAAMALDTKVVKIGSPADVQPTPSRPAEFGKTQFPTVQSAVESRAVDATTLVAALAKDKDAAGKQYGVARPPASASEISVKFTGVAGTAESGVYPVQIEGMPSTLVVRVQTGPAINGTDLRDATGQDHLRPVHQPDRLSERRLGAEQGDEEAGPVEDRHGRT